MQQSKPLGLEPAREDIYSGKVAARPVEAGDESKLHRVFPGCEDYRNRGALLLYNQRARNAYCQHTHRAPNQIEDDRRHPIGLTLGRAVLDRHVLAVDEPRLLQTVAERRDLLAQRGSRAHRHESHHRHRRLLRKRPERPRRRAAEQREELAPPIKKLMGHEAVATGLSSTEKPSWARRLTRRRACVSGRRRSKWVAPRSL